jgi:hypothetical protein
MAAAKLPSRSQASSCYSCRSCLSCSSQAAATKLLQPYLLQLLQQQLLQPQPL